MTGILNSINKKLKKKRLHMTLLDPDEQEPDAAAELAFQAEKLGTDAIMLGGSTGVTQQVLDSTVENIKKSVKVPVILFPTTASAISTKADAIYFMSLLNSRNPRFLIGEQMRASAWVKKSGLEAISMGYIIVEPGMKAGQVGEADLVKRNDTKKAVGYSVAAELLGMSLVYLEAGSGAPEPVPKEIISEVKLALGIPLLVGGGIRTAEQARMVLEAGADIIVTGTIVEEAGISGRFKEIIKTVKSF